MAKGKRELIVEIGGDQSHLAEFKKLLEGNLKITQLVKCNAGAGNQLSPAQKRCSFNRRQTDLSSGLTSHAYVFYLRSGLGMGSLIILIC